MDRYLFSGALLLLFLEVSILLMDLGVVSVPGVSTTTTAVGKVIGEMKRAEKNVRRRPRDSIVWEKSQETDTLFAYDAILTLDNSSAQIELSGDVRLNLDENTLVVLEPVQKSVTGSLRLRFSKGAFRSQTDKQGVQVQNSEWTLEASQGSDLSVRSLQDGKVELELAGGQATLLSADGTTALQKGERITIENNRVSDKIRMSPDISWAPVPHGIQRVYSHGFPAAIELKWQGHAERLRILQPDKSVQYVPVPTTVSTIEPAMALPLEAGTYHMSLESAENVSSSLTVQVRPAERVRVFAPLPRDRVRTGDEVIFSWEAKDSFAEYTLQCDLRSDKQSLSTQGTQVETTFAQAGDVHWHLSGKDAEGYEIPSYQTQIMYSVPRPLAAPVLNAPEVRAPAQDSKKSVPPPPAPVPQKPSSGALFWWLLQGSIAWAQETAKSAIELEAIFTWQPVAGAAQYVIEISEEPGFESPRVIERVKRAQYIWRKFKKTPYYWRVAAEGENGEMGYFSVPALADLSRPQETQEGVVIREVPVPKPVLRSTPAPVIPPEEPPPPVPDEEVVNTRERPQWHGRLDWQPRYHVQQTEAAENTAATFRGFVPLGFGLHFEIPTSEKTTWFWRTEVVRSEWKPKSQKDYPFQNKLSVWEGQSDVLYRGHINSWAFGAGVEKRMRIQREAPEAIKIKDAILLGPSAYYQANSYDIFLSLRAGDSIFGLRGASGWRYSWGETQRCFFGLGFGFGYITGSAQYQRWDVEPQLKLGFEW